MNDNNNPFNILKDGVNEVQANQTQGGITERIEEILKSDKIILFMKGNADFPQCGFSANSVAILKHLGKTFTTVDILQDMDIRQGLKEYSNWPTYPQLYVNGKLIGGNDIITEMFQDGDLQELLKDL
jgi:monothiol glutaredoxin